MESVIFSRVCEEDLDIGTGTTATRLQDGSLVNLRQLSLMSLVHRRTRRVRPVAGDPTMSVSAALPANARICGVTTRIITGFGTSNGLTALLVGDGTLVRRWGRQTTLTADAETDQGDFESGDWPVYAADTAVVITAEGGTFDATGELEVQTHYFFLTHRS